jgi:hypothetical protein
VGDEAPGHGHQLVAVRPPQREPAVVVGGAPQRGPVPDRGQGRPRGDGRVVDPTETPQRVLDDRHLELTLGGDLDVLPPAAATPGGHVGARRRDPGLGRRDHLDRDRPGVVAPLGHDVGPHDLARQRAGDEHDTAVAVPRQPVTADGDAGDLELEWGRSGWGHRSTLGSGRRTMVT